MQMTSCDYVAGNTGRRRKYPTRCVGKVCRHSGISCFLHVPNQARAACLPPCSYVRYI